MPQRRGFIVGLFPDLLSVGGVQLAGRQTAAALARWSAERDRDYRFLSLNDVEAELRASAGGQPFTFRGFHRSKVRFLAEALRLAQQEPAFVLAAHPNLAGPAHAMRFFAPRLRVAVMTHGIEVWTPLPFLRRHALRRADLVFAPSRDTAQKVKAVQGVREEKIRRLAWALDPDFLALAAAAEKLPVPAGFPEGRIILTVGRWSANERYKGADLLIRAMPKLAEAVPDVQLVAIGDGDDRPRLQEIAKGLGVSRQVHFLPSLAKPELAACYARCDVFALPSSGEGFGFVFLEAMALGKPAVGAARGGIPDLIEDGVNGFLVPPDDPERLVAALRALLLDESLRRTMGERARRQALEECSFERFEKELTGALDSLDARGQGN
jgi:phosphatidylinositol alpha-1,6-mannosyltransferase